MSAYSSRMVSVGLSQNKLHWPRFHCNEGVRLSEVHLHQGGYVSTPVWLFVVWFVLFGQDYTKTTGHIFTKLGGRMWYGSGKNSLHFVLDLSQKKDPGTLFPLSIALPLFNIFIDFLFLRDWYSVCNLVQIQINNRILWRWFHIWTVWPWFIGMCSFS